MKSLAGLLLAALSITPLVSAAAQFEGTGYLIKHFLLQVPRFQQSPPQFQNISLSFDLIDTDGSANTTSYTFCKAVWNSRIANAAPDSENRAACRDSRYGFYIGAGDFTGPHANLTLEAQHSFEDPSVGAPPWDWVTTFAHTTLSASQNITCVLTNRLQYSCYLNKNTSRLLETYGAIAK